MPCNEAPTPLQQNKMTKIIGFTGQPSSGKDTCFGLLNDRYRVFRFAFADELRQQCECAWNSVNGRIRPWDFLSKEQQRPLLQVWGTEMGRDLFGEDKWLRRLKIVLPQLPSSTAVVTDVRFDNEARFIKESGGKVFKLYRYNLREQNSHVSNKGVSDAFISGHISNLGTIEDLMGSLLSALKKENIELKKKGDE